MLLSRLISCSVWFVGCGRLSSSFNVFIVCMVLSMLGIGLSMFDFM